MCRPGVDDDLQRECYDGHHKVHGLVSQSVVFADGIVGDVHMEAGRRHDSYFLSQSNLNNRLAEVQQGNSVQRKVYGDAAYPIMSHIDRGFRGANLTPAQRAYNKNMSQVRICVEWMLREGVQGVCVHRLQCEPEPPPAAGRHVLSGGASSDKRSLFLVRQRHCVIL